MNLDELENYGQEDTNFQEDNTRNQRQDTNSDSVDHSITNYAEPDYGDDLSTDEINNHDFDTGNSGNEAFSQEETDTENTNDELEYNNDSEELTDQEPGNEDPDDSEDRTNVENPW